MVGAMKPQEVLTLVATVLGVVATVLNLVAFVREKDRSHLKAGMIVLLLLGLAAVVVFLPHLAPRTTASVVGRLPAPTAAALQPWLASGSPAPATAPPAEAPAPRVERPAMQGSATVDIRRNFVGGIDAIVGSFRFVDLTGRGGRVTSWRIGIQEKDGEPLRSFERVLEEPVQVPAGGTASVQVELDPEIGDRWLARREAETPGRMEIHWQGQDADGNPVGVDWADGVAE